ncbi:MAG: antibiotic biosynthesis monooxygenase [Deltaproteobacteria bacterium]|jgi:quinol monooxygenase YgiN
MIVVAKLKAKKGAEEEMEKVLRDAVQKVASEEGTLTYTLHRSQSDPCEFLFYEKYTDGEALQAHSTTPYFKAMFAALKDLVDGPADIGMYEELAALNR